MAFDDSGEVVTRAACLLGLLGANVLNLASYVRALRLAGSVVGSVVSLGCNIVVSGIIGFAVFDETRIDAQWCLGTCIILSGIALISASSTSDASASVATTEPSTAKEERKRA